MLRLSLVTVANPDSLTKPHLWMKFIKSNISFAYQNYHVKENNCDWLLYMSVRPISVKVGGSWFERKSKLTTLQKSIARCVFHRLPTTFIQMRIIILCTYIYISFSREEECRLSCGFTQTGLWCSDCILLMGSRLCMSVSFLSLSLSHSLIVSPTASVMVGSRSGA